MSVHFKNLKEYKRNDLYLSSQNFKYELQYFQVFFSYLKMHCSFSKVISYSKIYMRPLFVHTVDRSWDSAAKSFYRLSFPFFFSPFLFGKQRVHVKLKVCLLNNKIEGKNLLKNNNLSKN